MQTHKVANGVQGHTDWNRIDWPEMYCIVKNLRHRIFRATAEGNLKRARSLQKLMLRCRANVLLSIRRVTQQNSGKYTAGVDKVIIKTPQGRGKLADELMHSIASKSKPARRVYIPKANGKQRPLGIPVIKDRCIQAMVKNALEPEWEAKFEGISYGFRPGRGCQDAIMKIHGLTNAKSNKNWILDADIKGAFDHISHSYLEQAIGYFPARLLIKQWLRAGYMEQEVFNETQSGTPQGGVISPLLANIALHGMEKAIGVKYNCNGAIIGKRAVVRYADDFVVFCQSKEDAEKVKDLIKEWLKQRGLDLSEEKTRILHITEGFDFLGFHIRQYSAKNAKRQKITLIKPGKSAVKKFRERLKQEWRRLRSHNINAVIHEMNPVLRGWANYYRTQVSSKTFNAIDSWMMLKQYKFIKRRHPRKSWKWRKSKYWGKLNLTRNDKWVFGNKLNGVYMLKLKWFNIIRHILVVGNYSPDDPKLKEYWIRRNTKEVKHLQPNKQKMAKRQNFVCPVCKQTIFNGEELQIHHIQPKCKGGNNEYTNLVLLHLYCHQQVHLAKITLTPESIFKTSRSK